MDRLEGYINKSIAPKIQCDGGWVELTESDGNNACMRLQGECSKCAIAQRCMNWITSEVKRELDMDITISIERKKPFFWDM